MKMSMLKGIIKNYVIMNGKNFYDRAIDSDIKQYKESIKLTTGQGEDHTYDCNGTRTHNHFVNEHSTIWPNCPND